MQARILIPIFALFVLVGCGTDNPFDRGADLPGNGNEAPSGPLSFASDVKPALQVCASCHSGGAGGWVYTGGVDSYNAVLSVIDTINPQRSELLIKATGGDGHGGGSLFSANTSSYQAIATWISQGAKNN
jgi:hypothetical protein